MTDYGNPAGLPGRLAEWCRRMRYDRQLPWAGLGIIADLELLVQILNKTEWLDAMLRSDDPDAQRFARELLADNETVEAVELAASRAEHVDADCSADPVQTIENLDGRCGVLTRESDGVRHVLVEVGALADDDEETDIAALLRALLA